MSVERQFEQIGTRLEERSPAHEPPWARQEVTGVRLDVERDRRGEFFTVMRPEGWELQVLNVAPEDRHLVLLAKRGSEKARFLCGHDERHYFVAAIPEETPVTTVRDAKAALLPDQLRDRPMPKKERNRRRTSAFVRQGEWFFMPAEDFDPGHCAIHRQEPLSRGAGSQPHIVEELCRTGGETVYVNAAHPTGITETEWKHMVRAHPEVRDQGWEIMQRDAEVYARGRVRHGDHATIVLDGWHRVEMNTENRAAAMRHVAFLD